METILMSIHPKWCEKIFNGEKTIEVRKTAPNGCGVARNANGKVIGEFIVNEVDKAEVTSDGINTDGICSSCFIDMPKATCLTLEELQAYAKIGTDIKLLHITAPVLYDKPKELGEFRTVRFVRGYHKKNETMIERLQNSKRVEVTYVSKAPQNYMRIEEV